mmetsp:Transcript_5202/g.4779  ORF Transcript_5202/g.4779 Transcript_5202/m.4779 type:complete len:129 (+) Transcript_5202:712-1098(+)
MNKVIFELKPKSSAKTDEDNQLHKNYGKVPKYINKYRVEKEEENFRRRIEEEEAKIPPGTRLMGEEERLKTLEELQVSKKDINNVLERMPIAMKSMAMDRKKKELEERLMRIERAIETFSKKTVYIAL